MSASLRTATTEGIKIGLSTCDECNSKTVNDDICGACKQRKQYRLSDRDEN